MKPRLTPLRSSSVPELADLRQLERRSRRLENGRLEVRRRLEVRGRAGHSAVQVEYRKPGHGSESTQGILRAMKPRLTPLRSSSVLRQLERRSRRLENGRLEVRRRLEVRGRAGHSAVSSHLAGAAFAPGSTHVGPHSRMTGTTSHLEPPTHFWRSHVPLGLERLLSFPRTFSRHD
jgi:hypothetical protein